MISVCVALKARNLNVGDFLDFIEARLKILKNKSWCLHGAVLGLGTVAFFFRLQHHQKDKTSSCIPGIIVVMSANF